MRRAGSLRCRTRDAALRGSSLLSLGWIAAFALFVAPVSAAAPHTSAHHKSTSTQVGVASVYSHKFAGKKTASGKRFQPSKLTAASRKLPLNSKAKVTNLATGKSINVTITDRGPYKSGPYKKGRVLDLSPNAAKRIGVTKKQGVAPVAVEPLAPTSSAKPRETEANRPD